MEKNSFSAIGSGKEYALGSLCTAELDDESTDEDVIKVLQNAILSANLNLYCGGGGVIMNNQNKEIYEF
jgi:20S proteasome alpha/beta subunit